MAGTTVRIMYSVGLILTSPLQLFPAIKVRSKTTLTGAVLKGDSLEDFVDFIDFVGLLVDLVVSHSTSISDVAALFAKGVRASIDQFRFRRIDCRASLLWAQVL